MVEWLNTHSLDLISCVGAPILPLDVCVTQFLYSWDGSPIKRTTTGPTPWKGWGRHKRSQLKRRLRHSILSGCYFLPAIPFSRFLLNRALLWRLFWVRRAPGVGPSLLMTCGIDVRAEHNSIWFSPVIRGSHVLAFSFLQPRPVRYVLTCFRYFCYCSRWCLVSTSSQRLTFPMQIFSKGREGSVQTTFPRLLCLPLPDRLADERPCRRLERENSFLPLTPGVSPALQQLQ